MATEQSDFHAASFDAGWVAAVKTVSDAVAQYMELLKSDRKPDSWEKWLPRFLVELK